MASISGNLVNAVLHSASLLGIDINDLKAKALITDEQLNNPEKRFDCRKLGEIMRHAVERSGNENFALIHGEHFQPNMLSIVGYLIFNSPTVRHAFQKLIQYKHLIGEGLQYRVEENRTHAFFYLDIVDEAIIPFRKFVVESNFSSLKTANQQLIGNELHPLEVHFVHSRPSDISEYKRIFNCPIFFDEKYDFVVYPKSILDMSVAQANPTLYSIFEKSVHEIIEKHTESESLSRKVSRELIQLLKTNEASIEKVAANLAIGVRSLQRQLREEGLSYQALLNTVKKELAIKHLKSGQMSISEIAYILGFAEPSVFHRSFKKWTGYTPKSYRRLDECEAFV